MDTIFKKRSSALSGKPMKMKKPALDIALTIVNYFLLVFLVVVMLYPFWSILVKSFMSDRDIISYPYAFFPKNFQFDGYKTIFVNKTYNFGRAFVNSVFVTVVDTVYQLAITTMAAYALSKKTLPGRGIIFFYFIFTMYFGGGLIPYYMVIRDLNLLDSIWVLIIPHFISIFNVLVMRSFFLGIPAELEEAARIDGAGDFKVFLVIVIPRSKAVLATIALFIAVGQWNDWYSAMLFLQDATKRPMAYTLQVIIETCRGTNTENPGGVGQRVIGESIQYAAIIVSTAPIILVYPFLQKHFTKGVLIGSVKG